MAHGIADNLMMLVMSVAMLTMVISMLIMGVYWAFALLVLSGVFTAVATVFLFHSSLLDVCVELILAPNVPIAKGHLKAIQNNLSKHDVSSVLVGPSMS